MQIRNKYQHPRMYIPDAYFCSLNEAQQRVLKEIWSIARHHLVSCYHRAHGVSKNDLKKEARQKVQADKQLNWQDCYDNAKRNLIFAYSTLQSYLFEARLFCRSAVVNGATCFEELLPHAGPYLKTCEENQIAASTLAKRQSAIAKLLSVPSDRFGYTHPIRKRELIHHPSEAPKLPESECLICRSIGARKNHELENIVGTDLCPLQELSPAYFTHYQNDGVSWFVKIPEGKGGRFRYAPIKADNSETLDWIAAHYRACGENFVLPKMSRGNYLYFRAQYAAAIYLHYARDVASLDRVEQVHLRNELRGVILDRYALYKVAVALGHSKPNLPIVVNGKAGRGLRISCVTRHYIHVLLAGVPDGRWIDNRS